MGELKKKKFLAGLSFSFIVVIYIVLTVNTNKHTQLLT